MRDSRGNSPWPPSPPWEIWSFSENVISRLKKMNAHSTSQRVPPGIKHNHLVMRTSPPSPALRAQSGTKVSPGTPKSMSPLPTQPPGSPLLLCFQNPVQGPPQLAAPTAALCPESTSGCSRRGGAWSEYLTHQTTEGPLQHGNRTPWS